MPKKCTHVEKKPSKEDVERARLLEYFFANPDRPIPNAELGRALGEARTDSWTRRLRELREPRHGAYIIDTRRERPALQRGEYYFPAQERKEPRKSARISTRLRHEVFFRDAHSCQDCGLARGERHEDGRAVTLQVGHNVAESHGGKATLENCITLCSRCNEAESNVGSDRPTISKTLAQVKRLPGHERREVYNFLKRVFEDD